MAAYVIVDIEVTDPERYKDYMKATPATLEAHGGRFIVRGGRAERLEGEWTPRRIVVVEFESYDQAKAWWDSQEYAQPKALRQSTAKTNMVVVEGV